MKQNWTQFPNSLVRKTEIKLLSLLKASYLHCTSSSTEVEFVQNFPPFTRIFRGPCQVCRRKPTLKDPGHLQKQSSSLFFLFFDPLCNGRGPAWSFGGGFFVSPPPFWWWVGNYLSSLPLFFLKKSWLFAFFPSSAFYLSPLSFFFLFNLGLPVDQGYNVYHII